MLLPLLFSILLEVRARAVRQERRGIQIGKEVAKLVLLADVAIFYVQIPEESSPVE